jgi:hypothetical protein
MAQGSQAGNAALMSELTGLTHDIFVGRVVNNVRRESKVAMLFQDAEPGEYRLEGQNMTFALDLRYKTGALATDGNIPDHVPLDAVQGQVTPIRRYARIALDNLVERRASGPGAFDDLSDRIFDKLWDAWASMEIRHAIGGSTALVAKVASRTSSTIVVLKDGYGNADTNPLVHLSEGSIISWYDVDQAAIGGAGRITSTGIAYTTNTITLDSATTWETDGGNQIVADDLIYFATTNAIGTDFFTSERNLAPNGLGTIVDPAADNTTVFNIAQATYERHKPYRVASTTFDHLELQEHWLQLGAKRGFAVAPDIDVVCAYPSAVAQLARSLLGFQQQAYTGGELAGGYQKVTVSGIPIVEDHFFYHDVAMTLCRENLYRVNLGGDADFWGEDGSMWSRIADFDGKDAYVVDYLNYFSNHRGANGALTGISTDLTDDNFAPIPNY